MGRSIEFAKEQQKSLCTTAFSLFQKNKIKKTPSFSYAILNHESLGARFGSCFYSLEKMARIILSIQQEYLKSRSKSEPQESLGKILNPFVLCVFDSSLKRYFVLGKEPQNRVSRKGHFGQRFKEAAEKVKARYSLDSFENSLIEVHQKDFEKFLEQLIKG